MTLSERINWLRTVTPLYLSNQNPIALENIHRMLNPNWKNMWIKPPLTFDHFFINSSNEDMHSLVKILGLENDQWIQELLQKLALNPIMTKCDIIERLKKSEKLISDNQYALLWLICFPKSLWDNTESKCSPAEKTILTINKILLKG